MFTIRRYTSKDIDTLIEMLSTFLNEERIAKKKNYFYGIELSKEKIYTILKSNENNLLFFGNVVEDKEGRIVGALFGQIIEYIFSKDVLAVDHILYFDKDYKVVTAVKELIKSYEEWAEKRRALEVQLRISTGYKIEAFGILANSLGFKQFEAGYAKRLR